MSMSSLYGQHMEDDLNFSCVAFVDALFFGCFFLFCFVFSSGSRSGFSTVNIKKSIFASL